MSGVSVAVPKGVIVARSKEGLENLFLKEHYAKRQITTSDSFGADEKVRRDARASRGKHRPSAAETGNHLVADHQDIVTGADLADLRQPLNRRNNHAADTLDWLGNEGADGVRAFTLNNPLEFVGAIDL